MNLYQNDKKNKEVKEVELGRAIAQGIREDKAQQEKNMAKAEKRQQTMLKNAAEQLLSGTYGRAR